jgi:hypothetical protein
MSLRNYNIEAVITFSENSIRENDIISSCLAAFEFISERFTSGRIQLVATERLSKGSECIAEIAFFSDALLNDAAEGTTFRFFDGLNLIGSGVVRQFIDWVEIDHF